VYLECKRLRLCLEFHVWRHIGNHSLVKNGVNVGQLSVDCPSCFDTFYIIEVYGGVTVGPTLKMGFDQSLIDQVLIGACNPDEFSIPLLPSRRVKAEL